MTVAMPFADLASRVTTARSRIDDAVSRGGHGQTVTIVAVTKSHAADAVGAAFGAGLADVGENRVQEALDKMPQVSVPVRWHLIGHLQRNKVRALDRFTLFHALDSSRLADAVSQFAARSDRIVTVLVQVNLSGEATKGGFAIAELDAEADRLKSLPGLELRGVMTIARLGAGEAELRKTFAAAREARGILMRAGHQAKELSMGMSDDYELAVEEGATLVRLGTILFGAREQC